MEQDTQSKEGFFEYEYCPECHGDAKDHDTMVDLLGNPFYRCNPDAVCRVEDCEDHKGDTP